MARRASRTKERERLVEVARSVAVPARCDVVVMGGGAAGLVAAISAAERGASVVVLERDLECGRSILATGNGRCNFANVALDARRYSAPGFVEAVCGPRWLDDVLGFFRACGMRWCIEQDRLYPLSRQAASVRSVLVARARRAGVVCAPAREVLEVAGEGGPGTPARHAVAFAGAATDGRRESVQASAVILATGGGAAPSLDGLGLRRSATTSPVLCPLACEGPPLSELDGRRAHVRASLTGRAVRFPLWQGRGELLFRDYGISGILAFDLSRRAAPGDLVELDLAPDVPGAELRQLVDPSARGAFEDGSLDGVLDPQVAHVLERLARARWHVERDGREAPPSDAEALTALVKALPLIVVGPAEVSRAQVTRGGLLTDQFLPETLSPAALPWLFACGEALDVDADCGGFNLAWAWKSGMVAGDGAARRALS